MMEAATAQGNTLEADSRDIVLKTPRDPSGLYLDPLP